MSKEKRLLLFIIFFIIQINISECFADNLNNNHLWFEFGDLIKNQQGIAFQKIFICYGQFPKIRKNPKDLDELEVFYTFGEKNSKGEDIFYKSDVEFIENKAYLKISSVRTNWCVILARGRESDSEKYNYYAKTSFFIFDSRDGLKNKEKPALNIRFNKGFVMNIYREHLKEYVTYNRLLGFPIRFKIAFNKGPFGNKDVHIIEENGNIYHLRTDRAGEFVYIPADEKNIHQQIREGYRHIIARAEQKLENTTYNATYTVLLNIDYFHRNVNFPLGICIFIISVIFSFIILRKKFNYEGL